ncbi:DUF5753 domain-containing protein [Lentzea flava]|uniref:DUF5753 domain-containing protein n=1 Tax=Lentzea flava TaxID=103732 RepID=UPI00166F72A5|nr:DUF5753 domain-containing protein [Lentzea flava]
MIEPVTSGVKHQVKPTCQASAETRQVQLFTACGKDIDFFEDFRRRYRHAFDLYFVQVPENLRTIAMTESMAKKIVSFDIMTVHGLLQTERYARELFVDGQIEAREDIEKFVQARMERQTIMRRPNRPECLFYVHELALQTRLGDAQLMEDQYLRLLFNTHIIRVVPANIRSAAFQSKCTLYEFPKAAPVVFTETNMGQLFAQDSAAVERGKRLFERLEAVALDEEQSRSKLAEYVSGLREDSHDPRTDLA